MKYFGLAVSGLTLLLVAAAPDKSVNTKPLPGFPDIAYSASLLEPPGADGKPLLKIIRSDYLEDRKLIVWLVQLETDINFDELRLIDLAWCPIGSAKGPVAMFFDKDNVAQYFRDMKVLGKLYEGKKGSRIRIVLDTSQGFPDATLMEVRRP